MHLISVTLKYSLSNYLLFFECYKIVVICSHYYVCRSLVCAVNCYDTLPKLIGCRDIILFTLLFHIKQASKFSFVYLELRGEVSTVVLYMFNLIVIMLSS